MASSAEALVTKSLVFLRKVSSGDSLVYAESASHAADTADSLGGAGLLGSRSHGSGLPHASLVSLTDSTAQARAHHAEQQHETKKMWQ